MKKLFRRIRRFFVLSNSRLLSQIKAFQFLDKEEKLTKPERDAMIWYFKKMLLEDVGRFCQINKMIKILEDAEKERKEKLEKEKTSVNTK